MPRLFWIVAHCCGKSGSVYTRSAAVEAGDGALEVLAPVAGGQVAVRVAEIVLGHGPVLRKVGLGVYAERGLEAGDGALEVLAPVAGR